LTALLYTIENDIQHTYYEPALETAGIRNFREERRERYGKLFIPIEQLEDIPKNDIIYLALLDTFERLSPVRDEMESIDDVSIAFYRNVYTEDLWLLEVFDSSASKENGTCKLRELGGYDWVVGFGDNLNDLPLFTACDEAYAVSNARDELKAEANSVIGGNNDDGVVTWLEAHWKKDVSE
jgi:hydroxymethylpyrimidine pyrophosphatase-like HAD family hydrolase